MAVGNGEMWVTDAGDIEPGDYLISSSVPGCARKDDPCQFPVGYICARSASRVNWAEIEPDADGIKRVRISVLFESFVRDSRQAAEGVARGAIQDLNQKLEEKEARIAQLEARLAAVEALLKRQAAETFNTPSSILSHRSTR
jgi:hypothetical protein